MAKKKKKGGVRPPVTEQPGENAPVEESAPETRADAENDAAVETAASEPAVKEEAAKSAVPLTKAEKKEQRRQAKLARKADDKLPKKKNVKARLLVALIIVALLTSSVVVVLRTEIFGTSGNEIPTHMMTPGVFRDKQLNILVCGIDIDTERQEENTDLILLVNFDKGNGAANILQIPRDTYVGENLVTYGKINGLYQRGFKENSEIKGVEALATVINDQLRIPIDNYITITMEGFREAVDAMGGVTITPEEDISMPDPKIPEDSREYKAGETYLLDGTESDRFVRYRIGYDSADMQRMNVQRVFMKALLDKIMSLSTSEMIKIVRSVYQYFVTDFTLSDMISLSQEVKKISGNRDQIRIVRLPGEGVLKYGKYRVDVFTLHRRETAEVLNKFMRPYGDKVPETDLNIIEIQHTYDGWYDPGSTFEDL